MDFLRRNAPSQPQAPGAGQGAGFNHMNTDKKGGLMSHINHEPQWLRITFVVLLFSLTILAVAIALLMYFGKAREANLVSKDAYQAVFLTNGQVYFGKLKEASNNHFDLRDIYYLNTQQEQASGKEETETPSSFSLIKLGCELHGPTDQMIINRSQVTFWENLRSDGKVSEAIKEYKDQSKDAQKCEQPTDSTQQSPTQTTPAGTDTDTSSDTDADAAN